MITQKLKKVMDHALKEEIKNEKNGVQIPV